MITWDTVHYFTLYQKELHNIARKEATELTYRPALDVFLKSAAEDLGKKTLQILHEPRRTKYGAPDFAVLGNGGAIVGYIECKKPGENLEKLLRGEQLKKYSALSPNILLTDSWRFILMQGGVAIKSGEGKGEVVEILHRFFSHPPLSIGDAQDLAQKLALRCKWIKEELTTTLQGKRCPEPLANLLTTFRKEISPEMDTAEFADALAQTMVYGALLARLNTYHTIKDIYIENLIPRSFALLRELTGFLKHIDSIEPSAPKSAVKDTIDLINAVDITATAETLSFKKGLHPGDDPYLHFYEDFLAAYEPTTRNRRGVYYTPLPVVRFIARAIQTLLERDFKITDGLSDPQITALDFAAGTGTFMLEMMRLALENKSEALQERLLSEHLLCHFYGFELLIAPYIIAHLKLSQFLKEQVRPLNDTERLHIFITNTLEEANTEHNSNLLGFLPALADDTRRAHAVKQEPVLIITGNPPYSAVSQNRGEWITELIEDYKQVDGEPFGEKKHWLHDDYVKFIRFAQEKMKHQERGIVAIITNHGFLDNPTFRGMRQSLMNSFDQLYFLDLHGNSKKKERAPDGGKDENVFDIQQGVAISLLVKNSELPKEIYHADLWGTRAHKYRALTELALNEIKWEGNTTYHSLLSL